jgi:ankyrin repeat protein
MSPELVALFERLSQTATFVGVTFDNVNAANIEGDNALHWAARAGDLDAARLLIAAGIDVNQSGDLGYTPLHEACAAGSREMVQLLVDHDADLYAQTEGNLPFTVARLSGKDDICDLLGPLMEEAQRADPHVFVRVRIRHLRSEIKRLEGMLEKEQS